MAPGRRRRAACDACAARDTRHLTLCTRRICHLCDEMQAVACEAGLTVTLTFEGVDVDGHPFRARRYGLHVPVLVAGERELARHRVTAGRLRDLLGGRPAGHHP